MKACDRFALTCAAFSSALFVFLQTPAAYPCASAAIFFVLAVLLFRLRKKQTLFRFLSALLAAVFAAALFALAADALFRKPAQKILSNAGGAPHTLTAEIVKTASHGANYAFYDAKLLYVDGKHTRNALGVFPRVRVCAFGKEPLSVGDVVSFSATPAAPEKRTKDGFAEARYLASQRIFLTCTADSDFTLLAFARPTLAARLRERLSAGILAYAGKNGIDDRSAVALCMLLGDRSYVSDKLMTAFRRAGISHVLCVSGLHLSLLLGALSVLTGLRRRRKSRRFPHAELTVCLLAFLYMLLAGFTPSILRAGLMVIVINGYYAVRHFVRKFRHTPSENDDGGMKPLPALFCAMAFVCLVSPFSLLDVGMQLSFLSTLGILLTTGLFSQKRLRRLPRILHGILATLLVSFAAVVFTFPVSAAYFGAFSSVSLLSNLLVAPILPLLLVLLLFLAVLSLVAALAPVAFLCSLLGRAASFLAFLTIRVAHLYDAFPFALVKGESPLPVAILFLLLASAATFAAFAGKKRLTAVFCAVCAVLYLGCFAAGTAQTASSYYSVKVSACTFKKLPYVGVSRAETRLYFDTGEGLLEPGRVPLFEEEAADSRHMLYVVVPRPKTDFETLAYSLAVFRETAEVEAVLVPTPGVCESLGLSRDACAAFVESLVQNGYETAFYEKSFTFRSVPVTVRQDAAAAAYRFGNVTVVFADRYTEAEGEKAMENGGVCLFFCRSAAKDAKDVTKEGAALYLPSALSKKVEGSFAIPAQKPMRIFAEN